MKGLDASVIGNFQRRDKQAFAQVYDCYSAALYGIILRIVQREEVAQDVVQEAFVKIWKSADQYDRAKGTLFTWLLNIARNTAIDKIRSASYRREFESVSLSDEEEERPAVGSPAFDTDHIGLKALVDQGLEEKYRMVIDLMYFQGMTQREVQEYLGIPLGTVKSRTRIALRELRRMFQIPLTL